MFKIPGWPVRIAPPIDPPVETVVRMGGIVPELLVTVPDAWPSIQLAPLYDVHIGHRNHDAEKFARHLDWIARTPNVITWNGGDLIENSSKYSVGAGVYEQDLTPQQQLEHAIDIVRPIKDKMLFSLNGNHEARSMQMGLSVGSWMASQLGHPFFPDYCFAIFQWRGNRFRVLAHHGSGSAQTAGAQRMAARKAIAWAKPIDIFWTGHLHNPLVDVIYQTDVDQSTGEYVERTAFAIISPSYLRYFGSYAAAKQLPPGPRGLSVVELQADGRIDVSIHANGRRL